MRISHGMVVLHRQPANLKEGRHFGFELTIFRVGLLPPTVPLPTNSQWYSHSAYFAHFAVSDISNDEVSCF